MIGIKTIDRFMGQRLYFVQKGSNEPSGSLRVVGASPKPGTAGFLPVQVEMSPHASDSSRIDSKTERILAKRVFLNSNETVSTSSKLGFSDTNNNIYAALLGGDGFTSNRHRNKQANFGLGFFYLKGSGIRVFRSSYLNLPYGFDVMKAEEYNLRKAKKSGLVTVKNGQIESISDGLVTKVKDLLTESERNDLISLINKKYNGQRLAADDLEAIIFKHILSRFTPGKFERFLNDKQNTYEVGAKKNGSVPKS